MKSNSKQISKDNPKVEFERLREQQELDEVLAFPNPFIDNVTVSFKPTQEENDINIQIVDSVGKVFRIPLIYFLS